MSLILAILVFGLIVLIHEFGHFIMAKSCGIGVVEFSIGMGPRLVSFVKGETRYSIKALPFGGSCMMVGEDDNESEPKACNKNSVWARIAVIAAGPVFNFILAFVFALVIVSWVGYDSPQLIGVEEGFPAQEQGLQEGDIITRLNREPVVIYRDVTLYMMMHPTDPVEVTYLRPGKDGAPDQTGKAILTPKYSEEYGSYMLGISVSALRRPTESLGETLKYGAYEVVYWIKGAIKSIGMMLQGQVSRNDVAGPVRMVGIINETVDESMTYGWDVTLLNLINMCVLLSANLGIMNLLPIPALDGGRLLFLILEVVRGKPIDKEKEGMVHMAGMALLMCLMILVLFNDILYYIW